MQTLPVEITREIFLQCLDEDRWAIGLRPLEAPLLLTHVCHEWRRVALDYPLLWAWMRLQVWSRSEATKAQLQLLQDILARVLPAGPTLNLQLLQQNNRESDELQQTDRFNVTSFLVSMGWTLTRLTLVGVSSQELVALPPDQFPSLERLVLEHRGFEGRTERAIISAFEACPHLRRVALKAEPHTAFADPDGLLEVALPWHQITHFISDSIISSPQFFTEVLAKAFALRYLHLNVDHPTDGERRALAELGNTIVLDQLEFLSLVFEKLFDEDEGEIGGIFYPTFWDKFEFPNLKGLRLRTSYLEMFPDAGPAFLGKLSQFQKVDYLSVGFDDDDGFEVLGELSVALPNVTTLDLQFEPGYYQFFQELSRIREEDPPRAFPNLREIAVEDGRWEGLGEYLDGATELRRMVVYANREGQFQDDEELVQQAREYGGDKFEVERRLVGKERHQKPSDCWWVHRDPWLQNWVEVAELWGIKT